MSLRRRLESLQGRFPEAQEPPGPQPGRRFMELAEQDPERFEEARDVLDALIDSMAEGEPDPALWERFMALLYPEYA